MHTCAVLIALLRAARLIHHTAHHLTHGPSFYADHALFSDLYTALDDEIDTLTEKAVYMGADIDAADLAARAAELTAKLSPQGAPTHATALATRSMNAELAIQDGISAARQTLQEQGRLSLGMDNFLAQLADDHETALYKLRQRLA